MERRREIVVKEGAEEDRAEDGDADRTPELLDGVERAGGCTELPVELSASFVAELAPQDDDLAVLRVQLGSPSYSAAESG